MIELGGNIQLENFENLEPGLLIVVKKMVGSQAKKIAEEKGEFEKLNLTKEENTITAKLTKNEQTFEAKSEEQNLFFALSKALEQLKDKIK